MKSEDEIQRAHDLLIGLINEEVVVGRNVELPVQEMAEACAVLCWVLGHDHNQSFNENLSKLEKFANDHDYFLEKNK